MPEAATGGVLWKKLFLKILKNLQETSVPEETPVNFAKFLRAPFLQNKSEQLLLKRGHWKPKQEKKIVFVVERWIQYLLLRLKFQITRKASRHAAFTGIWPTISHACQSYIPDTWVLFLVPSVAERNKEAGWT